MRWWQRRTLGRSRPILKDGRRPDRYAPIGVLNYVLLKIYGARGVEIAGFLGGLVNSTVTVTELPQRARDGREALVEMAYRAILISERSRRPSGRGRRAPAAVDGRWRRRDDRRLCHPGRWRRIGGGINDDLQRRERGAAAQDQPSSGSATRPAVRNAFQRSLRAYYRMRT